MTNTLNKNIRLRFSPSPSGYLHVGGARTCLFNWLWAKKHNGTMVLRIEDTDQARSTEASKQIIFDSLQWLGLNWDEGPGVGGEYGPYVQSERLDIYKHYAEELIKAGKAYRCYCSKETLDVARKLVEKNDKSFFKYPKTCRDISRNHNGEKYVIRFKAPTEGYTEYNDLIFGHMRSSNVENQDWIIIREDGYPTYSWAATIDDHLMKISTVCRGSDHLINTPIQVMFYQAFGWELPEFAHLPLMRSQTNEKLSKRHGSVSISEYMNNGYSPQSVISYIAKFGWGHKDQELFTLDQLIEFFDWSGCHKRDGRFDFIKLDALNFNQLKSPELTSDVEYTKHLLPFVHSRGLNDVSIEQLQLLIPLVRYRSKTFIEAANELDPILRKKISIDDAAAKIITPEAKHKIDDYKNFLSSINDWSNANLKTQTQSWLETHHLTMKDIGQPVRVSIFGRTNSPDLFQVMGALGKSLTIERLNSIGEIV